MKRTSTETNICPVCGCTKMEPTRCGGCDWTEQDATDAYCREEVARLGRAELSALGLPPASAYLSKPKVRTIIRRPSRFEQNHSGYELTVSGLTMGRAIEAVRRTEESYTDLAGDVQEGLLISPDAWDALHRRHERARQNLKKCRAKMAAGQTCGNRSC